MFLHADSQDSDQNTQSDPNLRWVQRSFCWFCRAAADFTFTDLSPAHGRVNLTTKYTTATWII